MFLQFIKKPVLFTYILLAISLVSLTIGCEKSDKETINLVKTSPLTEEKMITVLTDIHLAESWLKQRKIDKDTLAHKTMEDKYQVIFDLHKVTASDFETSFQYYITHPDEMNRLYEKVIEHINKLEILLDKE